MTLKHVNLSTDVYFVCLNHAMSTDGEEIVGLLCGEVDENRVAHIVTVVILRRSDKRKDRVEISPEQLSNASTEADRLAFILKRPIRVIGWYHSHPKLTVWPSPIDVNTQDNYQLMDEGFIGVIFSVFNDDPNKKGGRIQMTCFQAQAMIDDTSVDPGFSRKRRLDIPVHLVPAPCISSVCMTALIQLPRFLCQEELLAYQVTNQVPLDYLTRLHNSSVYIKSMGQIAEVICGPLLNMLEERIMSNEMKRKSLLEKKKELIAFIEQAQIEKVHKDKEQLKAKEKSIPLAPKENQPSSGSAHEILAKKLESEKVPTTSNPTKCFEMSGIEKADKSPDVGIVEKISDPKSPEKSDITRNEFINNLPEMAAGGHVDKTEPKSTCISEQKETNTSSYNNDSDAVEEKQLNV